MNPPCTPLNNVNAAVGGDSRRNERQRDIVDDGIALMGVAGTLCALEYLKSHAVDGRVIARVLLDPGRRRSCPGLAAA